MKKYLVITIDVEPDCTPDWTYSHPLKFQGVQQGIAKKLQPLFNKYGITPTYLINNVVLEDQQSIQTFKSLPGKFELGTHLHPEFIEPQKTEFDYSGKKGAANCCFYPPAIESGKIKNITSLFANNFGYSPLSFRAGRFSAGNNTVKTLAALGYKIDTSVTPTVSWDDKTRQSPVDFRKFPDQPYWIGKEISEVSPARTNLLEVPVSIVSKPLSSTGILKYILSKKRIPYKWSSSLWLRPIFSNIKDFNFILDELTSKHSNREIVVYNMMFHNVEVMPGLSPYAQTEIDCENYLRLLGEFFSYINDNNIHSIELSGLYELFR